MKHLCFLGSLIAIAIVIGTPCEASVGVGGALSIDFEVLPNHALPGVPALFLVALRNHGTEDLVVDDSGLLETAEGDGDFSPVNWQGKPGRGRFDEKGPYRLHAGEGKRVLFGSSAEWYQNHWLSDSRFREPGSYRLRVTVQVASVAREMVLDEESDLLDYLASEYSEFKSNVAVLNIETPSGVDAEVWQFLREQGGGRWVASGWQFPPEGTLEAILERWPDSAYAPYAALNVAVARHGMSTEEIRAARIAVLERVLTRHPGSPAIPALASALAATSSSQAMGVVTHDLAAAKGMARSARAAIDKASTTADSFWAERLTRERESIPSDDMLEQSYAWGQKTKDNARH